MTRQQIIARAQQLLGETRGTPGADDPFSWNDWVDTVADDLARDTGCYYVTYKTDIVSGQSEYCLPEIYKIKAAIIADANGVLQTLYSSTPAIFDHCYGDCWRSNPATGTPQFYLTRGDNCALLYPTPDYAASNGLAFEGYATPGGSWPEDTAECPLPSRAHMAVVYGAALKRARQFRRAYGDQIADLKEMYREASGKLESETAKLTEAVQSRQSFDLLYGGNRA